MNWDRAGSRGLAADLMRDSGVRWLHVRGVALAARRFDASLSVMAAAWLHDIGYGDALVRTGMHAIDGALYLESRGAPQPLVSLVAFHTGAEFEARERGMLDSLLQFDRPDQDELDLLTLADMTTGTSGRHVRFEKRIADILRRYEAQHPVHRAVTQLRGYLEECCRRASKATGYPM